MSGKASYLVFRRDGLLVHTVPVTFDEAWWLYQDAYNVVKDRIARMRYLSEWGNVLDAADFLNMTKQMMINGRFEGVDAPPDLLERVIRHARNELFCLRAREGFAKFAARLEEFLRMPVEPRRVAAPVRYFESPHRHVKFRCCSSKVKEADPQPEWLAYRKVRGLNPYGVSVFRDEVWLWVQLDYTYAIAVRRDAADEEVLGEVSEEALGAASDDTVLRFLGANGKYYRLLINESEEEMRRGGYGDAAEKVKFVLAAAELLKVGAAGRREEEEGVPA